MSAEQPRRGDAPRRARRLRFGPGTSTGWSPSVSSSSRDDDEFWLEREIDEIARVLKEKGELRRRDLSAAVTRKFWGPGRFARALSEAVERGRVRRVGWGRYAPADGDEA